MARKSFISKINAGFFFLLACVVTLVGCDKADVGDEVGRRTTETPASFKEASKLTTDDTYGTATLSVSSEKFYGETSQGKLNGEAQATCKVSVESDPIETAHKEAKTYTVGDLQTTTANGNTIVTCDITVSGNGHENVLKTRTVIEPTQVWDNNYTLKLKNVKVDEKNVKMVETSKKAGESGRQALSIPVVFSFASEGTKESHEGTVTLNAVYEQFQLDNTPTIDHEELDSYTWVIKDGMVKVNHHIRQIWTGDHEDTFVDYPAEAPYSWNTISLEDKIVKAWKASLTKIEGLTVGTPYAVESAFEHYNIDMREDIYSGLHETEGETKCVYFFTHPKFTFKKGDIEHVCDFISPSFSETADELLDATSLKSGYDLKVFRNAVTVKYGNAETGIDERVLEERQNLYKQAKAVSGIEVISKTRAYPAFAVDYVVKYRLIYNDDTKSEELTATTSRPWSLSYDGSWSMTANGEVTQSTTAIVLTKGESKTERQEIANGYWDCTSTNYTAINKTTVDGKVQTNGWKLKVPTKMVLNLYNTEVPFDEDAPKAEAKNAQISLTNSTATQEDYKFSENLNVTVGTDTEVSEGYGFVTKAVEVTLVSWEWNYDQGVKDGKHWAFVEKINHMSDGSTKTIRREFSGDINANLYTYFETTEVSNEESTGAAQFVLVNTEHQTKGDWGFDLGSNQVNFGITYAGSIQKDGWTFLSYKNLTCTIEGETFTLPAMDMSASANSTQSKKSEDADKITYEHSNAAVLNYGGFSLNLTPAKGLVFVNKVVVPESHDGYFPKEYGKIEGYNRVACRNPHNQKDWGVGISVKFTNGSVCGFITKDGNIEWGSFEAGSTTWDGASPDGNGTLMNVTAKDASTAMKWMRGTTVNMLSYSDGTLMGFNWGNNTVYTDKFGGNIEQKDGGKYQVLTISGVNGSWDSSY